MRSYLTKSAVVVIALLSVVVPTVHAQTGTPMPPALFTAFDNNGDPISGAKLCVYTALSSTPANTYSDSSLSTLNANPVVMNSAGRANVFLPSGSSFKFVLRQPGSTIDCTTGAIVWSVDGVQAIPASSANLDILGVAGVAISAGDCVYLSDGSGSKTAGQYFKCDPANPYSSTSPSVGMAPNAISSGVAGTIRLSGSVTGLSALTIGATYYASSSGTISATPPANNRRLLGQADTTSSLVLNGNPNVPFVDVRSCNGRLTLTTGVPVTSSDVLAATTLYFAPYQGNRCALYDGTNWSVRTFAQLSIAVPATTSQMYDVWLYDNAGTLALELLAWTNDTTRATALVTQDGVYVKTGVLTRRYLGSFRTTAVSGQTEDSLKKRFVWNMQNRVARPMQAALETADTWTYTTNTWRQANANTANQLAFIVGVAEDTVEAIATGNALNSTGGTIAETGIGLDSTSAFSTGTLPAVTFTTTTYYVSSVAAARVIPAAGYHFLAWLEYSQTGTGTTTWAGDNGTASVIQSGIVGLMWG